MMKKLYAARRCAPCLAAAVLLSACVLALSTSAATDDERSFAPVVSSAARLTVGFNSQENSRGREAQPAGSATSDEEPVAEPDDEPLPADGAQVRSQAQVPSTSGEAPPSDPVAQYLWSVYQRSAAKHDSDGDFTWKDAAAAARMGLSMPDYVIGGMDPDLREQLFHLGQAMDAVRIDWTILSAFRDDYRQSLAIGFKAHVGNSFHGGSAATGGYGHGCAVDIAGVDNVSNNQVWNWLDQHAGEFGLRRPLPRIDPAHIQPTARWHERAAALRIERLQRDLENGATAPTSLDDESAEPLSRSSGLTEEQYQCVRPRPAPDTNQLEAVANRQKLLLAHLPGAGADPNESKQKRRAGKIKLGHGNVRHAPSEVVSRHAKWKGGRFAA
jgi:hypothetical protein